MNWFIKLSNSFKVALISALITVIAFLVMVFGYFIDQPDLPNGVLAGGLLGSITYLILGMVERFDEKRKVLVLTIVLTIVRFLLIGALLLVAALLQYQYELKVMNVFTVLGGYIISLLVYIVIMLIEKKHV